MKRCKIISLKVGWGSDEFNESPPAIADVVGLCVRKHEKRG